MTEIAPVLDTIEKTTEIAGAAGAVKPADEQHITAGIETAKQLVAGGHVTVANAFAALLVALQRGFFHF